MPRWKFPAGALRQPLAPKRRLLDPIETPACEAGVLFGVTGNL